MGESRRDPAGDQRALAPDEVDYVARARTTAHTLYEGVRVAHRSCGIALAETFGLATAADLIGRLRLELLGDRWTAIALGQAGARNALEGLSIVRTGRRLAFATSISIADARAFLTVVATLVDTYFDRRRPAPG